MVAFAGTHTVNREYLLREFASMVPVAPMGIDIRDLGDQRITLTAPLSQHINDKGNAFGGSLSSVMTLACWELMTSVTRDDGLECDASTYDSFGWDGGVIVDR